MNILDSKSHEKELGEITSLSKMNQIPSLVMIKKTIIFDLCPYKRLILSIFIIVLIPALVLGFTPQRVLGGEESVVQLLGFVTWYFVFSIIFPIIIISSTGPLISEELRSGTMLFLISKPISRTKVLLSKIISLYLFGMIISIISLSIIALISIIKYPFVDIGIYIWLNFIYSLIMLFFFGSMTMGFSSIFKKARNVLIIPLILVIFSFLLIMMFKPMLLFMQDNLYEKYLLYNFDLGYQFANVFLWIVEDIIPDFMNYYGPIFYMFGIVKFDDEWDYVKTEYYHPIFSLLYLIIIGLVLLIIGILTLKKRDIS
ncbi:MAG: ABC transporter permease [Promethearchaeota archaeon]